MKNTIERNAEKYLLDVFTHDNYKFSTRKGGERGFDLWLINKKTRERTKAELKAHSGKYKRRYSLRERLVFNSATEKALFEKGASVIVRVFLADSPIRVFIINHTFLSKGAQLECEPRFVIKGKVSYDKSYEELSCATKTRNVSKVRD